MTYDPSDVANGLLVHARPDGTSPMDRLVQELDSITDALLDEWPQPVMSPDDQREWGEIRGRAQGVAFALTVITCYTEEQVRKQNMIRRHNREEGRESHDRGDRPAAPPAASPRRRRRG